MDPDALREVMENFIPFNKFLGVKATIVTRALVRLEVPFREELIGDPVRPALHGGVMSALADAAGGGIVWASLDDDRARVSTIDLRIDYLRPGKLELLVAEAQLVRIGNRVGVADIRLFNGSTPDVTVATGKGVYNVSIRKTH
jgi:uncharacterized protein (TIGR00369 family)